MIDFPPELPAIPPWTPWEGTRRRIWCLLLLAASTLAHAQGGPPMVTDDPDTPGDGNWEINLASIDERTRDGWLYTVADVDINYGWGQRLQLKLDTPWNATRQGGSWASGAGTTLAGVKWRFYEDDTAGWAVSTYPQVGFNLDSATVSRGLADPGKSLFLPFEATTHLGPVDIDIEAGRTLRQAGDGEWIAGVILAHSFSSRLQMMFETREHGSRAGSATLLNLGGRLALSRGLSLLAAAGREAGAADPGRLSTLVYLGIQIHR
jgi:hypothetical protein